MVAQCAEEGLVDGAADELLGAGVVGEHVNEGVRLAFDPELVAELDVAFRGERHGFTGVWR